MPKIQTQGGSADVSQFDVSGALEQAAKGGFELLSPLVSIYRNQAEREAGVEAFRESVRKFTATAPIMDKTRNAWNMAADWLATTKPRIAAHMRQAPELIARPAQWAGVNVTPLAHGNPAQLLMYEEGAANILRDPALARDYMGHEATHVAQMLGNSNTPEMYRAAESLSGYTKNPFEISARARGIASRAGSSRLLAGQQPSKTIDRLRRILDDAEFSKAQFRNFATEHGNFLTGEAPPDDAITALRQVLQNRYGR